MPTKIIRKQEHIEIVLNLMSKVTKFPITVTWSQGAPRTAQQNRLSHRWYSDIAQHRSDVTFNEVRAECKLRFGVPILRNENEAFKVSYDTTIKGHDYETKLKAIEAFDLPVTRIMKVSQMSQYMDDLQRFWVSEGVSLTDPEALKIENEIL
jgi:hypothetical protein